MPFTLKKKSDRLTVISALQIDTKNTEREGNTINIKNPTNAKMSDVITFWIDRDRQIVRERERQGK